MNSKKMKNTRLFSTLFGLLIAAAMTVGASAQMADYFVDGATGDDSDTGASWALALDTLQKAMEKAAAAPGAQVIFVAAGTYTPDEGPETAGDEEATYLMLNNVDVYGGFLNGDDFIDRDPIANETILSGLIAQGNTAKHIVTFFELTQPAILDGFTVEDADTNDEDFAGGISLSDCTDVLIANCLIQDNVGLTGGGFGGLGNNTGDVLEIRNCRFLNNSANVGGGIGFKFNGTAEVNIINCEFSGNDAGAGGGLYASSGDVTVVNATFTENCATITNGGGAHVSSSGDAVFINSLFLYNTADDDGGALFVTSGPASAVLENCTLSKNHAVLRAGGIKGEVSAAITVINSILWGNTDDSGATDVEEAQLDLEGGASATVTYTCIQDDDPDDGDIPFGGAPNNNIDDDPIFVDEDGSNSSAFDSEDNFRLHNTSPCIEAGDNTAVDCDFYDVDEDGFDCLSDPVQDTPDLDFGDRIVDVDVDMGAYESVPCPWDIDGDCVVGAFDLLDLLFNWGPCPGCAADFDGDDIVGASDLLALLFNWGPCPCDPTAVVPSIEDEMDAHCLTMTHWDDFEDVMTDPQSSQAKKDNYLCWMLHYLEGCSRCLCIGESGCPDDDPFNG